MISLVGYTGFVGGNIAASGRIDGMYNTKNISEAFGTKPDLLIYSGLRAEKFLAEKFPEQDRESIKEAQEIIRKIDPGKIVLISTIDVYEDSFRKTEETPAKGQGAYGKNRAAMEEWVRSAYPEHLILRLPGLFGKGIRKNFIYDYIHYIPALLKEEKFAELSAKEPELKAFYALNDKGFYQCRERTPEEEGRLRRMFETLGFSALNFTDSDGVFQYYFLEHLYDDICRALEHNIKVLNITAEPVSVGEIYAHLTGEAFVNKTGGAVPYYDARTLYYKELGGFPAEEGPGGYLYSKARVLEEIKTFAEKERQV